MNRTALKRPYSTGQFTHLQPRPALTTNSDTTAAERKAQDQLYIDLARYRLKYTQSPLLTARPINIPIALAPPTNGAPTKSYENSRTEARKESDLAEPELYSQFHYNLRNLKPTLNPSSTQAPDQTPSLQMVNLLTR